MQSGLPQLRALMHSNLNPSNDHYRLLQTAAAEFRRLLVSLAVWGNQAPSPKIVNQTGTKQADWLHHFRIWVSEPAESFLLPGTTHIPDHSF